MSFAPNSRFALFQDEPMRRRATGNSVAQVLRLILLGALIALGVGLAMLAGARHATAAYGPILRIGLDSGVSAQLEKRL
ncbi:hypothetical protein RZS28_04940 [Methylocapsa polymorpha]|uniref:Uncharacterized protein n=1 Tax=Methylocapsa polymorpha TaxID=3080828 RepID=A0ABZ0HUP2_9HYPH|nr:hypothetical protein RZS28_04940 [Methylocapsa sp. RX1]